MRRLLRRRGSVVLALPRGGLARPPERKGGAGLVGGRTESPAHHRRRQTQTPDVQATARFLRLALDQARQRGGGRLVAAEKILLKDDGETAPLAEARPFDAKHAVRGLVEPTATQH